MPHSPHRFREFLSVIPMGPITCIYDAVRCILCRRVSDDRLVPLSNLMSYCFTHNRLIYLFAWL